VLAGAPVVPIRTASGRMYRENIAKAQRLADADTFEEEPEPVIVTRPEALEFA